MRLGRVAATRAVALRAGPATAQRAAVVLHPLVLQQRARIRPRAGVLREHIKLEGGVSDGTLDLLYMEVGCAPSRLLVGPAGPLGLQVALHCQTEYREMPLLKPARPKAMHRIRIHVATQHVQRRTFWKHLSRKSSSRLLIISGSGG